MKPIARLEDLTPDRRNANVGTARGRALLEMSFEQFGAGRSILCDKNGNIIAGNKTHEVAVDLQLPVRVIETTGHELIVVKRTDLELDSPSDTRARQLAYADNRTAEIGLAWDAERLLEDVGHGVNLDGVGFLEPEVAQLLERASDQTTDPATATQLSGPNTAPATGQDTPLTVEFRFGPFRGQVSREVYEAFAAQYARATQDADAEGDAMLDTVLGRAWAALEGAQ